MRQPLSLVLSRSVQLLIRIVNRCDVVTLNCPLHEGTKGIINKVFFALPLYLPT